MSTVAAAVAVVAAYYWYVMLPALGHAQLDVLVMSGAMLWSIWPWHYVRRPDTPKGPRTLHTCCRCVSTMYVVNALSSCKCILHGVLQQLEDMLACHVER